jgi:predicted permease
MRYSSGSHVEVYLNYVGPGFFHTLGIPVLQGRDVTEADISSGPKIVLVSEYFAKKYLRDGALGHRLDELPGAEIVGVVKDSKYAAVAEDNLPLLYYPLSQTGMMGQITVEVRTFGDPVALLPEMQRGIHELDPNLPLQKPMTQASQFAESYVTPRLFARLSLGFGLLAVVLVATGLYGTLAYRVQRRKSEIGIRMALGARRGDVLWMILRQSLLMASVGIALGLPMSFLVSRLLRTQLYHLKYLDAVSFGIALAITLFVTLVAALLPARRAAKVDPMVALRYE